MCYRQGVNARTSMGNVMPKHYQNLSFLIPANRPFAAILLVGSALLIGASVVGLAFVVIAYLLASFGDTSVSAPYMVGLVVRQKFVLFQVGAIVGAVIAMSLLVQYWNRIWAGFLADGK